MKALILSAGFGSRLKHKTKEVPKALIRVNDKAILDYQLKALLSNNIQDIIIVIGYKGQKVHDFTKANYPYLNIQFVENTEYETSNSSYSFWLAKDYVKDETYIHLNCDIIFSSNLLAKLINSKHKNVIAIDKTINLTDNMEQVILKESRIMQMDNKFLPSAVAKAFGVAKLSSESTKFVSNRIKQYITVGDKNQNYYGIIREAVKKLDYFVIDSNKELLLEVNTLKDLEKAEDILKGDYATI